MDSEIALALTRLGESTDRLLASAGALDEARAAPTCLPSWSARTARMPRTRSARQAAGQPARGQPAR